MPLLKAQKLELAKKYNEQATGARNVVVLKQQGIPVNEINAMRTELDAADGRLEIVKKRVFLKGVESNLSGGDLEQFEGSIAVLYSYNEEDQHAPLKVIQKHTKLWKKGKHEFGVEYIGGWYEKVWQDSAYVTELANLPSKEELIGKLLFMLNHPVSSLARAFKAIADQSGEGVESAEETPVVEAATEEMLEDAPATEEVATEDAPAEVSSEDSPSDEPTEETVEGDGESNPSEEQ